MLRGTVRIKINQTELNRLVGKKGPVFAEVRRVAYRTRNEARLRAGVDTGALTSSIKVKLSMRGGYAVGEIYSDLKYSLYHHEGTGIRGPRHRMIVPKRAKVLRWTGRSGVVFSMRSRGSAPNPFLVKALKAASPWPVRAGRSL